MAEIITGKEAMSQAIRRLLDAVQGQCHCSMETGFYSLDTLLCGIQPGQAIVLASRPRVGKSTSILNLINRLT